MTKNMNWGIQWTASIVALPAGAGPMSVPSAQVLTLNQNSPSALGTIIVAGASMVGIVLTTLSSSANNVFNNLVNNIGVLVAFYYGITGLACAWAFRKTLGKGLRANLTMVVLPFIGGVALLYVCWVVIQQGGMTALPDDVVLLSSIPALYLAKWYSRGRTTFFAQPRVAYADIAD